MNRILFVFVLVAFTIILLLRFYIFFTTQQELHAGEVVQFITRLTTVPAIEGNRQRFAVVHPSGEKIYITSSRFTEYRYGQRLFVSGTLREAELGSDARIFTLAYPEIRKVRVSGPADRFYIVIGSIQRHISQTFQQALSPVHASLLTGIVFGIKDNLPQEFQDDLEAAGVVHVIAASGMNVSMVAAFFFSVFVVLVRRRNAILLSVLMIWIYAFLAGLEASIVRATIMATFAFTAGFLGRQYFGFLTLFLTAYAMLLFNPSYLSDIGFQLSFLATLGILFVRPLEQVIGIQKHQQDGSGQRSAKKGMPLIDDLKITLAAQIATLPILLMYFGQYGLLSIPANLLILWTIPYLMILGGIAAVLSFVVPMFSIILLYLSYPMLWYFELVVSFFGAVGWQIGVEKFPLLFMILYYFLVSGLVVFMKMRKIPAKTA